MKRLAIVGTLVVLSAIQTGTIYAYTAGGAPTATVSDAPDYVCAGGTVNFSVSGSDCDGTSPGDAEYPGTVEDGINTSLASWSSTCGGTFAPSTGASTTWTAPTEGGTCTINATVPDNATYYNDTGDATDGETVTVLKEEFNACSTCECDGYDSSVDPNWISAMVGLQTTGLALLTTTPSTGISEVSIISANTNTATVSPSTPTASPQSLTTTGVSVGETEIRAVVVSNTCKTLRIAVYSDKSPVKIAIHKIRQSGGSWPTNVPTASGLQSYLNSVFDQSRLDFTVTSDSKTVNYDQDNDGMLDVNDVNPPSSEEQTIIDAAEDTTAFINYYYVIDIELSGVVAYMRPPISGLRHGFQQDAHVSSNENVTAHESGHALGLGHTTDTTRLMRTTDGGEPCKLIKTEWDTSHSTAP